MTDDDRGSFEETALPFMDDVRRFAGTLAPDPDEAADLVQETYLRAFRAWDSFTPGNCRGWLFTICRNTFYQSIRSRRNRERFERDGGDDDALPVVLSHIHAERSGIGDLFDRLDVTPRLPGAFREIPEPFREVVTLIDLQEFSYKEAADVLEVPIGTVRSRLFRGRRHLQDQLIDLAIDMGLASAEAKSGLADGSVQPEAVDFPPDCEVVVRALWDLIDSEVGPGERARLDEHLAQCTYCRAHEQFERRLVNELASLRNAPVPDDSLVADVRAALDRAATSTTS